MTETTRRPSDFERIFYFHADFKRTGSDLTLTGDDGHRVVIPGYFSMRICRHCCRQMARC